MTTNNLCDIDELKHQVREKGIAELKEYIENNGFWKKPEIWGSGYSVASGCRRFVAHRSYVLGITYAFYYKDVLIWSYAPGAMYLDFITDEFREKYKQENSEILKLHEIAFDWKERQEDCVAHQRALGIGGYDWPPPEPARPSQVPIPEVYRPNHMRWILTSGSALVLIFALLFLPISCAPREKKPHTQRIQFPKAHLECVTDSHNNTVCEPIEKE